MARPFRIGAKGGPGLLLASRTNDPNSETGRAVFQRAAGRLSVDDVLQRHGIPSQTESTQHSRSYFGPASEAVDP
jgi:hypothetical protein